MHHILNEICSKIVAKYTRIADVMNNLLDMFDSDWQVQRNIWRSWNFSLQHADVQVHVLIFKHLIWETTCVCKYIYRMRTIILQLHSVVLCKCLCTYVHVYVFFFFLTMKIFNALLMNIFHGKIFQFVFNIKEKKTVTKSFKKYIYNVFWNSVYISY